MKCLIPLLLLTACGPQGVQVSRLAQTACGTDRTTAASVVPDQPIWVPTPFVPSWGAEVDGPLPNILVVGDSISIGWTGAVSEALKDEYDVRHPLDNGRNSYYTSLNVDRWLAEWPNAQVILWNNGIWDSTMPYWRDRYAADQPVSWYTSTATQYEANLIETARKLRASGARVIFFTTTEIPAEAFGIFDPECVGVFNDIAKRVLPLEGVEVYDLFDLSQSISALRAAPNDVHFIGEGYQILGDQIVRAVRNEL